MKSQRLTTWIVIDRDVRTVLNAGRIEGLPCLMNEFLVVLRVDLPVHQQPAIVLRRVNCILGLRFVKFQRNDPFGWRLRGETVRRGAAHRSGRQDQNHSQKSPFSAYAPWLGTAEHPDRVSEITLAQYLIALDTANLAYLAENGKTICDGEFFVILYTPCLTRPAPFLWPPASPCILRRLKIVGIAFGYVRANEREIPRALRPAWRCR